MLKQVVLWACWGLFFIQSLLGQNKWNDQTISASLWNRIHTQSDSLYPVIISLKDQLDLSPYLNSTPNQQKSALPPTPALLKALQELSRSSQQPLLSFLNAYPALRKESLKTYWITNIIRLDADTTLLKALSFRPEIDLISWEPPVVLDDGDAHFEPVEIDHLQGHEPGHDVIQAPLLWKKGYTGYGRKVLVLDSGVESGHPALQPNYAGNYGAAAQSWYQPGGSQTPIACTSHGTFVTGIISGYDRIQLDTLGVAFRALWMAIPVVSGVDCPAVNPFDAFQWALDPDGDPNTVSDMPDVINNSWSLSDPAAGADCTSNYKQALDVLEAAGIAVIWSAGNQGPGTQSISSPKNINTNEVNSFCVGAIDGNASSLPIYFRSSRGPSQCPDTSSLSIKPEVVAPGRNVKSTGLNGTQVSSLTGTSFGTPHVSGAILLLKEAFPYLTGKDLMLALYHTGLDLGAVGEDNDFGNGLIQLDSAFAYLLNQGHIPVTVNTQLDIAVKDLAPFGVSCDSSISPALTIENVGIDTVFQMKIHVQYGTFVSDTLVWVDSLLPQENLQLSLPSFTAQSSGLLPISAHVFEVNGTSDYYYLDNQLSRSVSFNLLPSPILSTQVDTVCEGGHVGLRAENNGGTVHWYDDEIGGNILSTDSILFAGPLFADRTFFLSNVYSDSVGKENYFNDTGNADEAGAEMIFDCLRPLTLQAVYCFSQADGIRTFQVFDSSGKLLAEKDVFLNLGFKRAELDIQIPEGNGYKLTVAGLSPKLFTSTTNVGFPYTDGQAIVLTNGVLSDGTDSVYPYFYQWEITYESCRKAVNVPVKAGSPLASFSISDSLVYLQQSGQVSFTPADTQALSWLWDFGDGNTSTLTAPVHTYTNAGWFTSWLKATDLGGCTDAAYRNIQVVDWAVNIFPIEEKGPEFKVFPNPTSGELTVEFLKVPTSHAEILIYDLMGRVLLRKENLTKSENIIHLELDFFPDGFYWLEVKTDQKRAVKAIQLNR